MPELKKYVVGRGRVYFDRFETGTQTPTGERYLGNTPGLTTTSTYQNLDHYSSDEGTRLKDDTVQLQADRGGTLQIDNITMPNVALMFGSSVTTLLQGANTGIAETFTMKAGHIYQLGSNDDHPDGARNVTNVVVTNNSGIHASGYITVGAQPTAADVIHVNGQLITFVASSPAIHEIVIGPTAVATAQGIKAEINAYPDLYDVHASGDGAVIDLVANAAGTAGNSIGLTETVTGAGFTVSGATLAGGSASGVITSTGNFTIDTDRARITVLDAPADITDGDVVAVTYDTLVYERSLVVDEENQVEGSVRFEADNAKGPDKDVFWPRVRLTPNGEFALKGETWQVMSFTMDVLQPTQPGWKRSYITERP